MRGHTGDVTPRDGGPLFNLHDLNSDEWSGASDDAPRLGRAPLPTAHPTLLHVQFAIALRRIVVQAEITITQLIRPRACAGPRRRQNA